jgi:hypothetical protein
MREYGIGKGIKETDTVVGVLKKKIELFKGVAPGHRDGQ